MRDLDWSYDAFLRHRARLLTAADVAQPSSKDAMTEEQVVRELNSGDSLYTDGSANGAKEQSSPCTDSNKDSVFHYSDGGLTIAFTTDLADCLIKTRTDSSSFT